MTAARQPIKMPPTPTLASVLLLTVNPFTGNETHPDFFKFCQRKLFKIFIHHTAMNNLNNKKNSDHRTINLKRTVTNNDEQWQCKHVNNEL